MYVKTSENRDTLTISISLRAIRKDAANDAEYQELQVRVAELVARAAVLDLDLQHQILPWR